MRAIDKYLNFFDGNQSRAASAIGRSQQIVWWWKNKSPDMPVEVIPKASKVMGVRPADLRPDIFG